MVPESAGGPLGGGNQLEPEKQLGVQKLHPGLFQLVLVRSENHDREFVSKPVPVVSEFARLCNSVLNGAFDSATRQVDFVRLNESRILPVGLFGYNHDVWESLKQLGVPNGVDKQALQEGLVVWCPWLQAADSSSSASDEGFETLDIADVADTADDGSANACMYVCAWAGGDVESVRTHAPFNLQLRLLIELCDGIVVPLSDGSSFDPAAKPFQSNHGITVDFSVEEQMSTNTAVQVGQAVLDHGKMNHSNAKLGFRDQKWAVTTAWQRSPGGASLLAVFRISSTYTTVDKISVSASGCAAAIHSHPLVLSPELNAKMANSLEAILKAINASLRKEKYKAVTTVKDVYNTVLTHPALQLGKLLCIDCVSHDVEAMDTLIKIDLNKLCHHLKKTVPKPEVSEHELNGVISEEARNAFLRWFNVSVPSVDEWQSVTMEHVIPDFPQMPLYQDLLQMDSCNRDRFQQMFKWQWVWNEFAMLLAYHDFRVKRTGSSSREVCYDLLHAAHAGLETFLRQKYPVYADNQLQGIERIKNLQRLGSKDIASGGMQKMLSVAKAQESFPCTEELIALLTWRCFQSYARERAHDSMAGVFPSLYKYIFSCLKLEPSLPFEEMWLSFCDHVRTALNTVAPVGFSASTMANQAPPLQAAFTRDAQAIGFHMQSVWKEVAMAAVLGQHLTDTYLAHADPLTVASVGVEQALDDLLAQLHRSAQCDTREGWGMGGLLNRINPFSARPNADSLTMLNKPETLESCRRHADLLLDYHRAEVVDWISSLTGSQVLQVASRRMCEGLEPATKSQFKNVHEALQLNKVKETDANLDRQAADIRSSLTCRLAAVVNAVDEHCKRSCQLHPGTPWAVTDCCRVGTGVQVTYAYEETNESNGSWVADVLHKSAKGEADDVSLACKIVTDDVKKHYLTLLNTTASAGNRNTVTVRVGENDATPTMVYVHPPGVVPNTQHKKLRCPKVAVAARYEPTTRILALLVQCDNQAAELEAIFFAFSADFVKLQQQGKAIKMDDRVATAPEHSAGTVRVVPDPPFLLLPAAKSADGSVGSSKLVLILSSEAVRIYNILSLCQEGAVLHTRTVGKQWLVTPCCTALLAVHHSVMCGWVVDAYALEEGGVAQPLFTQILDCEELPEQMATLPAKGSRFFVASMDKHTYLLATHGERVMSVDLKLQSINVQNVLTSDEPTQARSNELPAGNRLLNYVHSCCIRFPIDNSLSLKIAEDARSQGKNKDCRVVRFLMVNGDETTAKEMEVYVKQLLDHAVYTNSKKPAGTVLRLDCVPSTSPVIAIQKISSLSVHGTAALGNWMRNAMCLVPLQLSRCSGNTLDPMHDGEQRKDFVEQDDFISMSKRLQLGLYEGILGAHNGPTKFVCALGQQSVGKSYHLNHMGGVFFDVAGGRCTDGVWMSARFVPNADGSDTLVVFLDCEGIGSPERQEAEDMLHCLLVGSVSSLTIFKTHYAFTTELLQTLQRLNKGAQKVEDIDGRAINDDGAAREAQDESLIFRGSLMFCLKDTPADMNEKRGIIKDFRQHMHKMVQASDNFVTAMYGNKVAVSAFPSISQEFYLALKNDCIERLQSPKCSSYGSGKEALYILKLMLIKMAHKDWTPINRQWIASQALQMRNCMHAVTHFGCEGTLTQAGALEGSMRLGISDDESDRDSNVCFMVDIQCGVLQSVGPLLAASPWLQNRSLTIGQPALQPSLDSQAVVHAYSGSHARTPCVAGNFSLSEPVLHWDADRPTDLLSGQRQGAVGEDSYSMDATDEADECGSLELGLGVKEVTDARMGTGQDTVRLHFTLHLADHELRLGFLTRGEHDGSAREDVSRTSIFEDLNRLHDMVLMGLGMNSSTDPDQFRLVHSVLSACIKALLQRRALAASNWLAAGVVSFKDSPEAAELRNHLDSYMRRLETAWQPCTSMCEQCRLPCTSLGVHESHSCGTDHVCHALCGFCVGEGLHDPSVCGGKAGHSGKHMCDERPHVCGKDCALFGKADNCNRTCKKKQDHSGDCDCESGNHLCGAPCTLRACNNRCIAPWGSDHDRHSCGVSSCPEKCPLCGQGCPEGHFHALEDPSTLHLCGLEHPCQFHDGQGWVPHKCEHAGACVIEGNIEVEKRIFQGKRAEFEYDYITTQDMKRQVCARKIPPGQLKHDGPHSCGRPADNHLCGETCPQCLYRCNKPMNHAGLHKTQHGNLANREFKASKEEFALEDRKYAAGDSAEAETCDSFCHRMGRGHIHTVHCTGTLCKSAAHDGVRHHIEGKLNAGPDGSVAVDEMTHDFFWENVGFEDPVKERSEQEDFRKCGNYCGSEEHVDQNGTVQRRYCLLDIFHQPLDPKMESPADHKPVGIDHVTISEDGCLFPCRHITAADVHTFLVIDRSSSMASKSISPDNDVVRLHPQYRNDNVLGVVYEAAYKYMMERRVKAPHDIISFLPFNTTTHEAFLAQPISDVPQLLTTMMATHADGGTQFGQALKRLHHTVNQWRASGATNHVPVAILLTDSGDWNKSTSTSILAAIMKQEEALPEAERLRIHVIGFGPGVDGRFIKELADLGNGSHMTCQAAQDIDRVSLVRSFARIAAQPALKVSLLG